MADLLATVLAVIVSLTAAGWWIDWLDRRWIVVAAGGAFVPDLPRVSVVVDEETVATLLGRPVDYAALETLGGVLLVSGIVAVWFERRYWPRVYALLVVGGCVHLLLDGLRVFVDGRSSTWLFPFAPAYRPPTPNLFVSSDPLVPAIAVGLTAVVLALDRWVVADAVW